MWKLKTFSGQTFTLTDKEKDFYLTQVNQGVKVIVFPQFVLSPNFEYLISEEQEALEKLRNNPILQDPDFFKLTSEDYHTRSGAIDMLNSRYAGPKYQAVWDEALKHKDAIHKLHQEKSANLLLAEPDLYLEEELL
jgi:hypothetical protein